ncbi:MAG: hypothetical protein M0R37_12535 [Bacteroidales bacterium]|nr:hypothetical protein [Bacteroidales bacterium]
MTSEKYQTEKRLAVAIRDYVAACRSVRRAELAFQGATNEAAAHDTAEAWRVTTSDARSARDELELAEDAFHAWNGRLEKVVGILDGQLLGLRTRRAA